MKLILKFSIGDKIPKAITGAELLALLKLWEAEGIKKGSKEYTRRSREAFMGRPLSPSRSTGKAKSRTRLDMTSRLLTLYNEYKNSGNYLNPTKARELQTLLVDLGVDLQLNRKDGTIAHGKDAIDGRIGDKTKEALTTYLSLQRAYNNRTFEEDYAASHNGALPQYNTLAGRDSDATRGWSNAIYQYYTENPYAEFRKLDLPYLTEDMKEMILASRTKHNKNNETKSNIGRDARAGYYGLAGLRWLGRLEAINVGDNIDRAARLGERAVSELSTTGQRLAGAIVNTIAGDLPTDWNRVVDFNRAFTLVPRRNEVTGNIDMVPVPSNDYGTRVSDVIGVENPIGAFAINTVTDPLFLLSARNTIGSLGRRAKAYTTDIGKANTNAFMEQVANGPAQPLAGSPVGMSRSGYSTFTRRHGAGASASHNASKVTSAGSHQVMLRPVSPNAPVTPTDVAIEGFTPYIGIPGIGLKNYGTNQYGISIDPITYWEYADNPDGSRYLNVQSTGEEPGQIPIPSMVTSGYMPLGASEYIPTAFTLNIWRSREPSSGNYPKYL